MAGVLDHPLIQKVRAELKSNPRARWLLAAVGVILIFWVWLKLGERDGNFRAEYDRDARQAARLETVSKESQWSERRTIAEGLRAQLESRLWSGDNESLERASYQDWITATARQAGIGVEIRAEIDPNTNNPAGLKRLSATVSGSFDAAAFTRFLSAIAQYNRLVVIDRLQIHALPLNRFDMTLITYLRPTAPAKASR